MFPEKYQICVPGICLFTELTAKETEIKNTTYVSQVNFSVLNMGGLFRGSFCEWSKVINLLRKKVCAQVIICMQFQICRSHDYDWSNKYQFI